MLFVRDYESTKLFNEKVVSKGDERSKEEHYKLYFLLRDGMDFEFESDVSMEETPAARIVIVDLKGFGFRREDMRVQINSRGNLIMGGERRVKEIEEMQKVGGRLQKIQIRQGDRFKKVIDVEDNLNFEGIIAKFKGEALRVYLPLVHILDQQNQAPATHQGHGSREPHATDQSVKSNDEVLNPVEQEDSIQEAEVSQNQYKGKSSAATQESMELLEEKELELLKEKEPKLSEGKVYDSEPKFPEVKK